MSSSSADTRGRSRAKRPRVDEQLPPAEAEEVANADAETESVIEEPRKLRGGIIPELSMELHHQVPHFLRALWELTSNPAYTGIVSWNAKGNAMIIHDVRLRPTARVNLLMLNCIAQCWRAVINLHRSSVCADVCFGSVGRPSRGGGAAQLLQTREISLFSPSGECERHPINIIFAVLISNSSSLSCARSPLSLFSAIVIVIYSAA